MLGKGEFKLFLQPKYNVARDCIDSAEALARWFDPERGEYRFPAAFIGLFETNGFIVKLDHLDFWLQIEMESYDALAQRAGFSLTHDQYNALQGTTISLPALYIYFEIVI